VRKTAPGLAKDSPDAPIIFEESGQAGATAGRAIGWSGCPVNWRLNFAGNSSNVEQQNLWHL
jgi:hypothetical protein